MSEGIQLLVFNFESSEKAYEFYNRVLNISVHSDFPLTLMDAVFAHRSERGQLRLEHVLSGEVSVINQLFTPRLVRHLQPRHTALLIYVEGHIIPVIQQVAKLYEINLLYTTMPEEITAQVEHILGGGYPEALSEPEWANNRQRIPREQTASLQSEATGQSSLDDLTKIVGIGPKIAVVLSEAGIDSYEKLAQMTVYELREILQRAGIVTGAILTTWNTQATYAANNDWTALYKFKRKLKRDAD